MPNLLVSILSADGLVPLGARPSADTAMAKFVPLFIPDQHFKG